MNKIILTGRLTKDLELRYTENNKAIGTFSIAINRDYKNDNGEYETDFINCVVFNQIAETMSKYTHKGDLIGIIGRLQSRTYEDKENKKHYVVEVMVEKVEFLQTKKETNEFENASIKTNQQQQFEITDEDLPF